LSAAPDAPRSNFIREIVEADLAAGRVDEVVTRFPPEPNGYLHIGHAKAICLDFGIARDYGGRCRLRFDDTNPAAESPEYVEAIERDVRWLGFAWDGEPRFASDYFERMYDYAVELVRKGLAYVDSQTPEQIRTTRGTPYEPGTDSPYRGRGVAENEDLLARMRAGEFPDGAHVLRARIDMAHPNIVMRDPPLYRIKHVAHHRTGEAWCLYPMYDFAHCLEDAVEGVTHSLCTLEFQDNRAIYDWILDNVSVPCRPHQYEFARLALDHTVLSKRRLVTLVEGGHVDGWDDPRMPTLAAFRRRGVRPEAIRAFCEMIGVAKTDSTVDVGKLEYCIRDDLNTVAPRVMAVLDPIRLVITSWPPGQVDELEAPSFPPDVGKPGSRAVPFAGELLIERGDFAKDPPPGWKRLSPGAWVRLRHGYLVRCDAVVEDERGEVVELRCTHDPDTRGGDARGREVAGTIHWVSAAHAPAAEVRVYDRLFAVPRPGADPDVAIEDELNPDSLRVFGDARVEPSVAGDPPQTRYQFERQGYFWRDPLDGRGERLVFARIVSLRDSWARRAARAQGARRGTRDPARGPAKAPSPRVPASHERDAVRAADPGLAARLERYRDELGLPEDEADILSGDRALGDLFEQALAVHDAPASVAKWAVNEVLAAAKGRALAELPFGGRQLGALVGLLDEGTIAAPAAKEVFAELCEHGGEPARIVEGRGLRRLADEDALAAAVEAVLAEHPDEVRRYRAGETKLLGFFMGRLMKATRGAADPEAARALVRERLG